MVVKKNERLQGEIRLVNRGFSTFHNPRPVLVALIARNGDVHTLQTSSDPRTWQPFAGGDSLYRPLEHAITLDATLPNDLAPGQYRVGLWLPDAAESLRLDPRYAVKVANGDVLWWVNAQGKYGLNVLATIAVAAADDR